jgi:hypothetical protein
MSIGGLYSNRNDSNINRRLNDSLERKSLSSAAQE